MIRARNVDELQRDLEEVFDLNQVEDCRRIIEVLLQKIENTERTSQGLLHQLKMLSLMVLNGNKKAQSKASEILGRLGKSDMELMKFLMRMVRTSDEAKSMTMQDLIGEVLGKIWSGLDMSSRESAVLGELIDRVKTPEPQ